MTIALRWRTIPSSLSKHRWRCFTSSSTTSPPPPPPQSSTPDIPFLDRVLADTYMMIPYDQTVENLWITNSTRVIYQGFTGKAATGNAQDTIKYGTNVVGGVTPGKGGTKHFNRPVYDTVRKAVDELKPDATAVFVPARLAAAAIEEAVEAEVPLIVSVTEHVPLHDLMRVQQVLRTQSKSRLVGPNCPGIINPGERCRIGIMPHRQFVGGSVGIVSKSGTVSYEAVGSTTAAGLGQSLVVGVGGDMMPGTTFVDALKVFVRDWKTKAIAMFGEIGGDLEFEAAEFLQDYCQSPDAKPICGLVTGITAPRGKLMGHSGAVLMPGDRTAEEKMDAWRKAGVEILDHPGMVGPVMRRMMIERGIMGPDEVTIR